MARAAMNHPINVENAMTIMMLGTNTSGMFKKSGIVFKGKTNLKNRPDPTAHRRCVPHTVFRARYGFEYVTLPPLTRLNELSFAPTPFQKDMFDAAIFRPPIQQAKE